jgi:hypothetical protein
MHNHKLSLLADYAQHTIVNVAVKDTPGAPSADGRAYGTALTVWVPHPNARHAKKLELLLPQKANGGTSSVRRLAPAYQNSTDRAAPAKDALMLYDGADIPGISRMFMIEPSFRPTTFESVFELVRLKRNHDVGIHQAFRPYSMANPITITCFSETLHPSKVHEWGPRPVNRKQA